MFGLLPSWSRSLLDIIETSFLLDNFAKERAIVSKLDISISYVQSKLRINFKFTEVKVII
jgi:hypothetical protein